MTKLPLEGVTVLEFCQYLAGPYAGLRLADLGARVIKVERPRGGDACRALATKDMWAGEDSVLFHTINRNKESFAADLKDPEHLDIVRELVATADVVTHNFRPGVMERIGLDYEAVKAINPEVVYGEVSGYGKEGPWAALPGQDLLAQARTGAMWHSGAADDPPTPLGLAVADMACGLHLAQGILAALVRRRRTGQGGLVEVSLAESLLDVQFEGLTVFLNHAGELPARSRVAPAHPYLGAPYGVYATSDSAIALSMGDVSRVLIALGLDPVEEAPGADAFVERDEIKAQIEVQLATRSTAEWMARLNGVGHWACEVLDYARLADHDGYRVLGMEQVVSRDDGISVRTTRCPIRVGGERLYSDRAAPRLGDANEQIMAELAS
ncbi:CaiB/BaiF CoA transferase family protein [Demequina rhizosphaerae]|uniref:CaiB/BaiF CoA transferase family protein n=1 Tax=Demequina rhizosphaerae TaxID=1638985 RepID=UPI000781E727|nr:CoA transferase [Demequina rhizosphaerae]